LVRLGEQGRKRFVRGEFEPIPEELRAVAEKKLAGRYSAVVSLSSGGKPPEYYFEDYSDGRFAWDLTDVKQLPQPIPAKGKQKIGIWIPEKEADYEQS